MTLEASTRTTNILDALQHAAASDIGLRREENQDSLGVITASNFHFYFVADGMGGVKGGAVASRLAVKTVFECLESRAEVDEEIIRTAIYNANHEIFEKGVEDAQLAGMGTTLVGLLFNERGMFIVNVGDSRAYRIRSGKTTQLTEDHTLVMELLRSGAIAPDQVENHPVSHMLTRSLGPTPAVEPDCWIYSHGPARGDVYLLCSDGLYNLVQPSEISRLADQDDLEKAASDLISLANERGGTDNITVILIRVGDSFDRGPEDFPAEPASSQTARPAQFVELKDKRSSEKAKEDARDEEDAAELREESRKAETVDSSAQTAEFKIDAEAVEFAARPVRAKPAAGPLGYFAIGGLVVAGLFVGYGFLSKSGEEYGVPRLVKVSPEESSEVSAPRVKRGELADLELAAKNKASRAESSGALLPSINRTISGHGVDASGFLTHDESASIKNRLAEVSDYVGKLENKIQAFDRPIQGKSGEILKETQASLERQRTLLDETRNKIEIATRKLSIWYGRRKRLESTDPINLATEVSVASSAVKEKREIFERSSWEYLKEYEVLRYNPSDSAQERKVNDLARIRKSRMRELIEEVRNTIDAEVSAADKDISDLTAEREGIQRKIDALKREADYQQVLLGGDTAAKDRKRLELSEELSARKAELEELRHLAEAGGAR